MMCAIFNCYVGIVICLNSIAHTPITLTKIGIILTRSKQ